MKSKAKTQDQVVEPRKSNTLAELEDHARPETWHNGGWNRGWNHGRDKRCRDTGDVVLDVLKGRQSCLRVDEETNNFSRSAWHVIALFRARV